MRTIPLLVCLGLAGAAGAQSPTTAALRLDALQCRYAQPGDRVDVLIATRDERRQWRTSTIAQDLLLVAVKAVPGSRQAEATLSFKSPDEAARFRLEFARKDAVFTILLRPTEDHGTQNLEAASYQKLFR
jgi:Flp pilus assembly protein CpaB